MVKTPGLAAIVVSSVLSAGTALGQITPQQVHLKLDAGAAATDSSASLPHLDYYGGPVIANVKPYAVFWGSSVDATVQSKIGDFYTAFTSSGVFDWLSEYDTTINDVDGNHGTGQHIGHGSFGGKFTIAPSHTGTALQDSDIQAELAAQIAAGHLPAPDANAMYFVNFPKGVKITMGGKASCEVFCAYHGSFKQGSGPHVYYAVIPDMSPGSGCDVGCGRSAQMFDNLTSVTSHEMIEAVTDADVALANSSGPPLAWYDASSGGPGDPRGEIGDICNGLQEQLSSAQGTFTFQKEWSNKDGGCKGIVTDDFSISVSPGGAGLDGSKGQAATFNITTAVTKGTAPHIGLRAVSVPSGFTVSFSQSSITAGASTTVTVTSSATAPNGMTYIGIVSDSTQISRRSSLAINVTGGVAAPTCGSSGNNGLNLGGLCIPLNCKNGGGIYAWLAAALLLATRALRRRGLTTISR